MRLAITTLIGLLVPASVSTLRAQPVEPTSGTTTKSVTLHAPPYYSGGDAGAVEAIAILPIGVAPAAPGLPESWIPSVELGQLATEMTHWIERSFHAPEGSLPQSLGETAPPRVYFGCRLDDVDGECLAGERDNILATTSATRRWREALRPHVVEHGFQRVLVLEIGLAPQWIRQRNLKGAKEIRLGTGRTQDLPWLTSLDTPVWVLQVRGVAVDAEGRVVRSGVEGIWALRTPFKTSALGAQKVLSPADVEYVRTELRWPDDAGRLAWEVALRHLIRGLGGPESGTTDASP